MNHSKPVKHAMKIAEKHGSDKAKKEGLEFKEKEVGGVKVAKKDFLKGKKVNS